ncbi:MAG: hypothetical protein WCD89_18850 [Anaerocolumna sp.]
MSLSESSISALTVNHNDSSEKTEIVFFNHGFIFFKQNPSVETGKHIPVCCATCLGMDGRFVKRKRMLLNYGTRIKMFGNAITNYDMNIKVDEITK